MQYNIIIVVCMYKWWTVCWEQYLDVKGEEEVIMRNKTNMCVYRYVYLLYFIVKNVASSMSRPPTVTNI
jgi:nitrogen fixation-related uncharacterized protein